ncbi:membrane protein insertase YidC [Marinobacter nanhaiticus D15-8W]|uniref:Membrane protein insertase YidC n=1 Tax=Marinobacter nanhaiticus D15-8W TaxID=626887 RepID=N6X2M2_9GAMM|nr:membrane protein insertase YidC [Marinobacter nanhaiticus]ENO15318.1 membrane protein insertase YidC [Marinobacter nanhaiticus D15-8W]BES73837.1 membrane protein insertase YidC [Marinobacter nanhaiticus D15-8W]
MDIQRTILWIGLAIVSYLMVLAWNEDYHQAPQQPVAQTAEQEGSANNTAPELSAPDAARGGDNEFATPEDQGQTQVEGSTVQASDSGKQITVRTDVLELNINLAGGNVTRASLLKYRESRDDPAPLKLLQNNQFRTYVLESGMIGRDGFDASRNGPIPTYQASQDNFTLGENADTLTVDLTFTSDSGVEVTKRYTLQRDSYEIDVRYLIDNQSESAWQANFAGKIVRDSSGDPTAQQSLGIKAFLGMVLSTNEDPYQKYDFEDLRENPISRTAEGGWIAFLQHYFLSAWIPDADSQHKYQTAQRNNLTVMGFVSGATTVEPGQQAEVGARAYVGPKIIERLETVAPNLDRTVDFGFLFFIALPLFIVLDWFHDLVGNWGVAIILLTVSVKLLFFKLSATSYRSMARMRAVAPQLTRLRELYGDDRQRMSQEMMALYKREKINPLGGCLPILVQMPVFISLYWVLFESVQLRHAPFVLWIHDLSVMDPYFILPILMGASMFIQMSLNPTPPDPMQAKVMKLMPLIFTVFFLWFPAGLVLYWLVNNVLSIAQQWYITRKIEAEGIGKKA